MKEDLIEMILKVVHIVRRNSEDLENTPIRESYMSVTNANVLIILNENPSMNQKTLAVKLGIRPQSLGESIIKLEEMGIITRSKDPADKRNTLVQLSELGRSKVDTIKQLRAQKSNELFNGLDESEKEQLNMLLNKIITSYEV